MNLRNLIELIVLLGTAAALLPVYLKKRREVDELDGFSVAEKEECAGDDNFISLE